MIRSTTYQALVAVVFILPVSGIGQAAMLKTNFLACRDKSIARDIFLPKSEQLKKNSLNGKDESISANNCTKFTQGQKITVDERDGELWCIRPSGELECYWTLDKAINVYDLGKSEKEDVGHKK